MANPTVIPESILRWALENSDPQTLRQQAQDTQRKPISPRWIEAILGEPDAVKMRRELNVLHDAQADEEARIIALENLEYLVEGIDNANDLPMLGGIATILEHIQHSDMDVQCAALSVLAACVRNNPFFQQELLAEPALSVLLHILTQPNQDVNVYNKALLALSAFLRNYEPALIRFVHLHGAHALLQSLYSNATAVKQDIKFLRRGLFLLAYIIDNAPGHVSAFSLNSASSVSSSSSSAPTFQGAGCVFELALEVLTRAALPTTDMELHERILEVVSRTVSNASLDDSSLAVLSRLQTALATFTRSWHAVVKKATEEGHNESQQMFKEYAEDEAPADDYVDVESANELLKKSLSTLSALSGKVKNGSTVPSSSASSSSAALPSIDINGQVDVLIHPQPPLSLSGPAGSVAVADAVASAETISPSDASGVSSADSADSSDSASSSSQSEEPATTLMSPAVARATRPAPLPFHLGVFGASNTNFHLYRASLPTYQTCALHPPTFSDHAFASLYLKALSETKPDGNIIVSRWSSLLPSSSSSTSSSVISSLFPFKYSADSLSTTTDHPTELNGDFNFPPLIPRCTLTLADEPFIYPGQIAGSFEWYMHYSPFTSLFQGYPKSKAKNSAMPGWQSQLMQHPTLVALRGACVASASSSAQDSPHQLHDALVWPPRPSSAFASATISAPLITLFVNVQRLLRPASDVLKTQGLASLSAEQVLASVSPQYPSTLTNFCALPPPPLFSNSSSALSCKSTSSVSASSQINFGTEWWAYVLSTALTSLSACRFESLFAKEALYKHRKPRVVVHGCDWFDFADLLQSAHSSAPSSSIVSAESYHLALRQALCIVQLVCAWWSGIDEFVYHIDESQECSAIQRATYNACRVFVWQLLTEAGASGHGSSFTPLQLVQHLSHVALPF